MFKNKGIVAFLVVIVAFIFFYTFSATNNVKTPPSLEYKSRLEQERLNKDKFFKENKDSPLVSDSKFEKLNYFPIDEKFKVIGDLVYSKIAEKETLSTSGNKPDTLVKFGVVSFKVKDQFQTLTVYKTNSTRSFFIPFRDLTSGKETYGGGRYLDVPITDIAGNKMVLDFNLAYLPYCAYNEEFICPIPPKSNDLKIAINAGEKL